MSHYSAQLAVVEFLIQSKADVDATTTSGETVVAKASERDNPHVLAFIMANSSSDLNEGACARTRERD